MAPTLNVGVWAQRRLPEGSASWGRYAEPRWHRIALVNETSVVTQCQRVIVVPVNMRSEVPEGGHACQMCLSVTPKAN